MLRSFIAIMIFFSSLSLLAKAKPTDMLIEKRKPAAAEEVTVRIWYNGAIIKRDNPENERTQQYLGMTPDVDSLATSFSKANICLAVVTSQNLKLSGGYIDLLKIWSLRDCKSL